MLTVAAVVIALLIGFLIYVATRPNDFRIERTQSMNASPEAIFPLINDLRRFNSWNPFALSDPSINLTYSGPDSGKGAVYNWDGAGRSGQGRMEITESSPSTSVTMQLQFQKPFVATNAAQFAIVAAGNATRVTWAMTGRNGYVQKLMSMVFNMDKMVGGEFAKGLNNLKALVER